MDYLSELKAAAKKYSVTLMAHLENSQDYSMLDAWDKATAEFTNVINNDEMDIIVSILAELEASTARAERLEAALAKPVRLPDIECSFCANSDRAEGHHEGQEFYRSEVADAIHVAGFTVECDLCSACNERYCGNCAHANGAIIR